MISSILATETEWGTITAIKTPPHLSADAIAGELLAAGRADLANLVTGDSPDVRVHVEAGGTWWFFGGL